MAAGLGDHDMKLSIEQIYEAARAAGFTPDQATTWTAIALAESGGETGALNDTGEHSMGLWQINVSSRVRANTWGNLNDPFVNARAAYEISRNGTDMRPWTTTHASHAGTNTDYRTYLDDVSAVTGYAGDGRGVGGYGSPLPPPLEPSTPTVPITTGYDQIDLGMDPGSRLDTDSDGLTDAFEQLAGSSPDVADTDQDGLSDAHEVAVSGTDSLRADTDADGLTDSTEEAVGTSGTQWDTDLDGASDGVEVRYDADPMVAENGVIGTPAPPPSAQPLLARTAAPVGGSSLADAFVQTAVNQRGDRYGFGAEASLDDPDPDVFDCSELTQWAADQVGVTIPDGAMYQYLDLKSQGQLMSVDEALRTKGALLFYFSSEPTAAGGRPSSAHVAISLGDGRTIEARGTSYGVNEFPGADRFNYAGVIPEMSGMAPAGLETQAFTSYDQIDPGALADGVVDADGDGLSNTFEQLARLNPLSSDSDGDGHDDAFEQLSGTTGAVTTTGASTSATVAALAAAGLDAAGDEDADGLSNRYELEHDLDAQNPDTDLDGLTDSTEVALGSNPSLLDSDADGLTDRIEIEFGSDPLTPGETAPGLENDTSGGLEGDVDLG